MLNGLAPILIFHFYNKDLTNFITGLPFGDEIASVAGLPIPIYLDEKLTGIFVDNESKTIDLQTTVEPVVDKDSTGKTNPPIVKQTVLDSTVTVNMFAHKDSILLSAILAVSQMILKRATSSEYGITYLNRSTTIFGGLLHRFATTTGANDDLIRIEMTLSTSKQSGTEPKTTVPPVPNVATQSLSQVPTP